MTLTSVIIPACNEEAYIAATIESFRRQIENPFQTDVIVVANGCTDDTANIAHDLGAVVLELEEANVSKARNYGARRARGDLLIFNDADTIVAPDYIEVIAQALKRGEIDYGVARAKADKFTPSALTYALMLNFGGVVLREACGNLFVETEYFDMVNGFNEELTKGEDNDLSIRLRERGAQYGFVSNTYFQPSSRAASLQRIFNDTLSYIRLRSTGKLEEQP